MRWGRMGSGGYFVVDGEPYCGRSVEEALGTFFGVAALGAGWGSWFLSPSLKQGLQGKRYVWVPKGLARGRRGGIVVIVGRQMSCIGMTYRCLRKWCDIAIS